MNLHFRVPVPISKQDRVFVFFAILKQLGPQTCKASCVRSVSQLGRSTRGRQTCKICKPLTELADEEEHTPTDSSLDSDASSSGPAWRRRHLYTFAVLPLASKSVLQLILHFLGSPTYHPCLQRRSAFKSRVSMVLLAGTQTSSIVQFEAPTYARTSVSAESQHGKWLPLRLRAAPNHHPHRKDGRNFPSADLLMRGGMRA
jgi:hypothetical protein